MIFFVNIGSSLASKIQSTGTDFKKYLPDASVKSLFFTPTNEHEICQIVNTFKGCKAPGIDEFSPKVVKSVIDLISVPLSCIFNQSICEGVFPEKLKLAKVSPVFKKGNKSDMNNYRPISVLSVFSKILERLVYKRVYSFLEKNNILYGSQFGFRKGLSTSMALLEFLNKIVDAFEKDSFVMGIFIDLSKAFDTINHEILLTKLYNYGLRGIAHKWFFSYLTNRKQCTRFNNSLSDFQYIRCGVPQGTLLGPLLFLLYVNDIYKSAPVFSFTLYADDTNILYSDKDLTKIHNVVNDNLKKVCHWFKCNKLSVNSKKCNYIVFRSSSRRLELEDLYVRLNEDVIPRVDCTKFLGVIIDEQLTWKPHIAYIQNKIAKNIGIIFRLSTFMPKHVLRTLYCTLVLPYFSYCNIVWGSTYQSRLKKLCILQKKIVRIISGASYRAHADPLFCDLKLLKLDDINALQQCNFVYKCVNDQQVPQQLRNFFNFNQNVHEHNTRSSGLLHIPRHRKHLFQHSIRYTGTRHWNNLPKSLKKLSKLKCFSYKVKERLLKCYHL